MFGLNRFTVKKTERALLLRNGDFVRVLQPGKHWVFAGADQVRVETFALDKPAFTHPVADYLMASEPGVVAQDFVAVELTDTQVGLRYENDALVEILPPATRKLFWKGLKTVRVDVRELGDTLRVDDVLLRTLTNMSLRAQGVAGTQGVLVTEVPDFHLGMLMVDQQIVELLPPGRYGFWRFNRDVNVVPVDLRAQALEVSGQEILSKDKVALRLNLVAVWRFVDVRQAFAQLPKPVEHVYRELQFGLRAAVGTRTLDALLEDKGAIDETVLAHAKAKLAACGMVLESVGVKDIILPGEMKAILAQVVEAEKAAQANVIRRREETAATRSLLNTAKVMEDNPIALRMKELETLERVAERIDKISVVGGLDQVLNGLVKLR